jgi:lysophospholipase L1-like esterase
MENGQGARRQKPELWRILLVAALSAASLSASADAAKHARQPALMRIFIAGDSTAQIYGPDRYPQMSWGMVLQCGFGGDVTVLDYAKGGRSTKSFIAEGRLDALAKDLAKGDTLLIAFGHNDESADVAARFTDPDGDFREYLRRYVAAARAKGAEPVLLTPVTRRSFEDGKVVDTHAIYARAVREVAADTKTPLIDLDAASMAWLEKIGPADSRTYYMYTAASDRYWRFPDGSNDDTHFSEMGARGVANLIADGLAKLNLPIAKRVKAVRPGLARPVPLGTSACQ